MSSKAINPFGDLIVKDPRRPEPAVGSLNERPFRTLLAQFEKLATGDVPRELRMTDAAQLVTSEQPGYGKSHLIGRLFCELHKRATLVYVYPFQNAATAFQSLMLATVREMHFPDRATTGSWSREEPTQLDLLAHSVLAYLLASLIEEGGSLQIETDPQSLAYLRTDPLVAFDRGRDPWAKWLVEYWDTLLPFFEEALARRGLHLAAPGVWLRVLRAYAFHPFDVTVRRTCMDWMTAQPLDVEELTRIGLRAADGTGMETSPEEASTICRTRIVELCQLASFFRPFVFCFDQTEVYGHHAALARAFGMVVATLVHEVPNHLTLITANQEPWLERIRPYLEKADLQRIAQPPVTLEGLNREQASELARLRMSALDIEPSEIGSFLDPTWLAQLFPTERNQMGARNFLQKCKERWEAEPLPTVTLEELYMQRREKLLASPKRLLFEPDILQWLVEEAARGQKEIAVEPVEEKYFSVRWATPDRICLFGFVAGSNWQQWRAIARAAVEKNAASKTLPVKAVFFRAQGQPPIPGPTWKIRPEIESAMGAVLQVVVLSIEELAELYAARDLFADAAQGDIAYGTEQVREFLRTKLGSWWSRLGGPVDTTPRPPAPEEPPSQPTEQAGASLPEQVREIVKKARFLSVEEVLTQLNGSGATRDEVLAACGFTPQIRVHSHPNMTVLQWQKGE